MPKIICTICDSESFDNIDGFYYCSVCGNQSKNICDIELSEEELAANETENTASPVKETKIRPKEDNYELENSVERNFSTFDVYNHLLKRQCDDLVKNGVDPIIRKVVLKLWIKYLQKLEIAFVEDQNEQINSKNIKWKRDKIFFEIYHLDVSHSKEEKVIKIEQDQYANESFDFGMTTDSESNNQDDSKMAVDVNNENDHSQIDSDEESVKNDDTFFDELDTSNDLCDESKNNILLTKFEWIRMPHTIALLNLGLLIIKSQILLTDLIRFMYDGKVSYFNIDEVLPAYMEFKYKEDSYMFNHLSVPQADYLRYLTSKLGKYLEINEIELIELKRVSNRYVLDLNLPIELISIIDLLMEKEIPIEKLSIKEAQYENIEALALSYILVSIIILFIYDHHENKINSENRKIFNIEEWLSVMQNKLASVEKEIFGCEFEKVRTVEDLKSLKISNFKQRHKLRTKKYMAQYRRNDIISTLNAPLDHDIESIENDMNNLDINRGLFYLSKSVKFNLEDFSSKTIEPFLSLEKLNLIGHKGFVSKEFRDFVTDVIKPGELRGRYLVGLETSTLDWLIEVFAHIAQTKNFFQMFNYVIKLLKKIK